MAKLKPGYQELRKTPAWATYVKRRWPDGRVLNVEGEMWLYRTVPLGPVEDARSPELSAIVGETLRAAFGPFPVWWTQEVYLGVPDRKGTNHGIDPATLHR